MERDLPDPTAPQEPPPPSPFAPVRGVERVGSVDVLRGVALLGILVMNIYAFGLVWPAYTNPLLMGGTGPLDMGTWWVTHLLFEMKFMTIFSMLFGAGLALMAERAEARGQRFGGVYYRRIFWLLVMGATHAYLVWFGDILFWYAICGALIYPMRRLRPAVLLVVGAVVVCMMLPVSLLFGTFVLPEMKADAEEAIAAREAGEELTEDQSMAIEVWEGFHPTPEKIREEIEVYRGSSWIAQVAFRAPLVLQFQIFALIFFAIWRILGLMLIGMGLLKLGVFSARRSARFYVLCCLIGYGAGLPIVWWGARKLFDAGFDVMVMNSTGFLPNYFGSLGVAAGHVGVVMLVCRAGLMRGLTDRLAAVGRMALTNYLSHSFLCTAVFYGWGLGLFASMGRFGLMGVVLAVWIFQIVVSPIWLRHFRFGPAEWIWRSLTYARPQPMTARPASQSP